MAGDMNAVADNIDHAANNIISSKASLTPLRSMRIAREKVAAVAAQWAVEAEETDEQRHAYERYKTVNLLDGNAEYRCRFGHQQCHRLQTARHGIGTKIVEQMAVDAAANAAANDHVERIEHHQSHEKMVEIHQIV